MTEQGRRGRMLKLIIAVVIGLSGLVWIGQGIGWIGGSFMSGDPTWAYIGAGAVVIALLIAEPWRRD